VGTHADELDHSFQVVNDSEYVREDVEVVDEVLGHSAVHHAQTDGVGYDAAQNEVVQELGSSHV
jgi:hypothetical protein